MLYVFEKKASFFIINFHFSSLLSLIFMFFREAYCFFIKPFPPKLDSKKDQFENNFMVNFTRPEIVLLVTVPRTMNNIYSYKAE